MNLIDNIYDDRIAIIDENNNRITYRDLSLACEKISSHLSRINFDKILGRYYVISIVDNSFTSIALYISCIKNNIPLIMIDAKEDINNIFNIISKYRGVGVIACYNRSLVEIINEKFDNFSFIDTDIKNLYILNNTYKKFIVSCDKLALVMLTSGSTGSSKGVRISYDNLKANTEGIIKALGITLDDKVILNLSITYVYGLSILNTHLMKGATIVLTNHIFYENKFWERVENNNVTTINGVPFMYKLLCDMGSIHRLKLLKKITVAGGSLDTSYQKVILDFCKKNNIEFYIMYGQTEATARISSYNICDNSKKIGSVGKPLYNLTISVDSGELLVSGKSVSLGYLENENDLNTHDVNRGKNYTGDLGYIDSEGYIYITARKKRIAKINGYRIDLDDLERKVYKLCQVKCYAIENSNMIHIFYMEEFNNTGSYKNIKKRIKEVLKIDKRMIKYHEIDRILLTKKGTPDFNYLKELIEQKK